MGLRKEEIIQESITRNRTRTVIAVEVEGLLKIIIVWCWQLLFTLRMSFRKETLSQLNVSDISFYTKIS